MPLSPAPVQPEPAAREVGRPTRERLGQQGGLPRARPAWQRELLLITALFLLYRLARLAITGQDALAIQNAWWVWGFERALAMPDEEMLQDWLLQWPDLLMLANWYYVGVHFPVTAAFLLWGWARRPPAEYRWARRLITVLTALALLGHVAMPLAPPRMLQSLGFLDTMAAYGPSAYKGSAASVANQFAAMPSLHVGWALLVAVVVVRTARSRWRWGVVLHPLITLAVVVATANHYWVDAIAAALLLAVALAVTPGVHGTAPIRIWRARRRRVRRLPPSSSPQVAVVSPRPPVE